MIIKNLTIYFFEDTMQLFYRGRVISKNLNSICSKGYIVNRKEFMEEFIKTIKKEKIRGKLFGDEITIIKNAYYSHSDLFYLESIFNELGFVKVYFLDIRELLPEEDVTYVEINSSYMVLYFDQGIFLDLQYFLDIPKILSYFSVHLKNTLVLFGTNANIPKIKVKDKEIYYFENYKIYITDSLLKVKKCDG